MPKKRADQDPVITAFVRRLIGEWRDSGRQYKELATLAKMPPSVLTQILSEDMGVGAKNRARFARAFGYADEEEFRQAAQSSWALARGAAPSGSDLIDEVAAAEGADPRDVATVKAIRGLHGGFRLSEEVTAELRRQRQVREERERDAELRRLREAAGVKAIPKATEGTVIEDAGTDDAIDDFTGGAASLKGVAPKKRSGLAGAAMEPVTQRRRSKDADDPFLPPIEKSGAPSRSRR